jgi:hypothetical protein
MTICTRLVIKIVQIDIKLFLGQAIFTVKILVKNEAF